MVWADRVEELVDSAAALEKRLITLIWSDEANLLSRSKKGPRSTWGNSPAQSPVKGGSPVVRPVMTPSTSCSSTGSEKPPVLEFGDSNADVEDPEKAKALAAIGRRPVALISPIISGLSFGISLVLMCLGFRESVAKYLKRTDHAPGALAVRYLYDGNAARFALVIILPFVVLLLAFPANVLVSTFVSHRFRSIADRPSSKSWARLPSTTGTLLTTVLSGLSATRLSRSSRLLYKCPSIR